jgi:hypothetical protein
MLKRILFGFGGWLSRYHNGEVKDFSRQDGLQAFVQPIFETGLKSGSAATAGWLSMSTTAVSLTEKRSVEQSRPRDMKTRTACCGRGRMTADSIATKTVNSPHTQRKHVQQRSVRHSRSQRGNF